MYGALALAAFALVATASCGTSAASERMLWLAMLGAAAWALYSVWRAYSTYYAASAHFRYKAV